LECIHVLCKYCREDKPKEWSSIQRGYIHRVEFGGARLVLKCFASPLWSLLASKFPGQPLEDTNGSG